MLPVPRCGVNETIGIWGQIAVISHPQHQLRAQIALDSQAARDWLAANPLPA